MMAIVKYELLRGFAYRRIIHPGMRVYSTYIPLVLATACLVLYYILPVKPQLLGKDGLLMGSMGLLSILPGFYFAGLAAVATFQGPGMDVEMPDPAPQLSVTVRGVKMPIQLSRRLFLSYLFSYLVLVSLILCTVMVAAYALFPSIVFVCERLQSYWYFLMAFELVKFLSLSAFTFAVASMITTTLQGVFFLAERMHQP